jgi:hypothetical protein
LWLAGHERHRQRSYYCCWPMHDYPLPMQMDIKCECFSILSHRSCENFRVRLVESIEVRPRIRRKLEHFGRLDS